MRHKVLSRAGWKHIFGIPGFENMSPGDVVKAEWKYIFLWIYDFLFFILLFIIFFLLNFFRIAT